ncbi:uncharacterized protein [Amphiura filiformis]
MAKLRGKFSHYVQVARPAFVPCYFGNSISNDLLKLKGNEWKKTTNPDDPCLMKDYSVLSVGCENLRNVIETTACLPEEFKGNVNFTLNDVDPFVQARNVLFLYMMFYYNSQEKIECTVSTICYSLHLEEAQYNLLVSCLRALTKISGTALAKITDGVMSVSDTDMALMKEVWQGWLNLECRRDKPNSTNLHEQRAKAFADDPIAPMGVDLYRRQIPQMYVPSVDEWLEHGVFMPGGMANGKYDLCYDNPTLTGFSLNRVDEYRDSPKEYEPFVYCVPVDMYPFGTWDYLKAKKFSESSSLIDTYFMFISSRYTQMISAMLSKSITIHFHIGDCLKMQDDLPPDTTFDRIFTSNLVDDIGTLTIAKAMRPLLNPNNKCAVLITQYWNWYNWFPNAIVDNIPHVMDGTYERCLKAAAKDTEQHVPISRFWIQEYYNNTIYFVHYLRADYMCCIQDDPLDLPLVKFQDVRHQEGLRMRDFRRELNKVVPFRFRRNIRPVTLLRGMSRNLEWHWD